MKVCLLNDSFPPVIDGVANVVMNYGRIMQQELGAEVVVGTPCYPDADYSGYPYRVIAYPSLDTTKLVAGYRMGNPLAGGSLKELADFGPQIIHSHCPAASMLMARFLQTKCSAPMVFTYHTKFDVDIARAVGEGTLKKEAVRMMIDNISVNDEVWTVSRGAGENLRSLGYEGEYRVVSNGVDFAKGRADAEKVREVTGAFDLPGQVPVFLFVGRIMKYKGLPIIIDAMKILRDEGMDYRCVFVGGGADAEEMREKAKGYDLGMVTVKEDGSTETFSGSGSGRLIFTGPIHDREALRAWNSRADLFLFPSVYDTNGIVVREAAACALGSVLIEGSCAAEGITDGRNGYTIPEDAAAMAALLQRVCGDMDAVHQVGQHAMDEIYISWEESVKEAYERYGELREMWESGELIRRRRRVSDLMLEGAAGVAEVGSRVFHLPRDLYDGVKSGRIYEGMMDNVAGLTERVLDGVRGGYEGVKDGVSGLTERVLDGVKEGYADVKEGVAGLPGKMRDGLEDMKTEMSELPGKVREIKDSIKEGISGISHTNDGE